MDFSKALKLLKAGRKIKRKDWSEFYHIFILQVIKTGSPGEMVSYIEVRMFEGGNSISWNCNDQDILAEDWVEYEK